MVKLLNRLILLSLIILLIGCGKNSKNAKDKQIELYLGISSSSPEETNLLDNQIAAFEKENPNIKVVKQIAIGNFNEWLQINVAAGTAPDLTYINSDIAKDYISYGVFKNLNDYFTQEELADFYPSLLSGFSVDDKLYGIPKDFNTLVMYYNKDMFKAAGIKGPPKTWKELSTTLDKLKKAGQKGKLGEDFLYPMSSQIEWNRLAPFIYQNGGNTYENNKLVFDSKAAAEALDFFFSLVKKNYVVQPIRMGNKSNGTVFGQRKTAIIYTGGWQIPYLKVAAPNLNYGIARLPGNIRNGSILYTVAYAVLEKSKHPDETVKLLKFLTGVQAEKMTAKVGLAVPSRISVRTYFEDLYPNMTALATQADYSFVFNWGISSDRVNSALNKVVSKMYIDYTFNNKEPKAQKLLNETANTLKYVTY